MMIPTDVTAAVKLAKFLLHEVDAEKFYEESLQIQNDALVLMEGVRSLIPEGLSADFDADADMLALLLANFEKAQKKVYRLPGKKRCVLVCKARKCLTVAKRMKIEAVRQSGRVHYTTYRTGSPGAPEGNPPPPNTHTNNGNILYMPINLTVQIMGASPFPPSDGNDSGENSPDTDAFLQDLHEFSARREAQLKASLDNDSTVESYFTAAAELVDMDGIMDGISSTDSGSVPVVDLFMGIYDD